MKEIEGVKMLLVVLWDWEKAGFSDKDAKKTKKKKSKKDNDEEVEKRFFRFSIVIIFL